MTNVRDAETLDRSAIDMLVEDIGVEDLVSLLDTYFDCAPALSAAMDEGLAHEDRVAVGRAAHTLKSNAAMLGAMELSRVCARLEDEAESQPWPALHPQIEVVKRLCDQAATALRSERVRLAAMIETGA